MNKVFITATFILLSLGLFSQSTNTFKIGICGGDYNYTIQNGAIVKNRYIGSDYSSVYGLLGEDGFTAIRSYEPWMWKSKQMVKDYVSLVGNSLTSTGPKLLMYNDQWFKASKTIPHTGTNDYKLDNNDTYFMNNDDAFYDVYNVSPYKDIIWGSCVAGESDGPHYFCPVNLRPTTEPNNTSGEWINAAVPPSNVNSAFAHFKNIKLSQHKLVNGQVKHGGYIDDYTKPNIYKISDYFKIANHGDVQLEASYFHRNFMYYFTDDKSYLGKYISMEYEKKYYNDIHAEIDVSHYLSPFYITDTINYKYITCSNPLIQNFNQIWFQAYTSIIHGAKGIWFWSLGSMYSTKGEDVTRSAYLGGTAADRFQHKYMPLYYEKFLQHLVKELRYLVNNNLLSDDQKSIIYTKTTEVDELGIVPAASSYIPNLLTYQNCKDLFQVNGWPSNYSPPSNVPYKNEFHGLRYTLRTNGSDIIMIISNPNPYSLKSISLDFCRFLPISSVNVLFRSYKEDVNSYAYKVSRTSFNGSSVKSYTIPAYSSKVMIDFGPFDTHTLKLVPSNTKNWHNIVTPGPVASNSDLALEYFDESNKKIWYYRPDGIVAANFPYHNTWSNMWFPSYPKAIIGSGMAFNNNNGYVESYYVSTYNSDNVICRIYWNGSQMNYQWTAGTYLATNSDLAMEWHSTTSKRIWFMRKDGIIACTYPTGSSWTNAWFPYYPKALSGSSILYHPNNGKDEVFYVSSGDKICRIYWNGSNWTYDWTAGTYASTSSDLAIEWHSQTDQRVWYIRKDGIIAATYPYQSGWASMWFPNLPAAKIGSGLYFDQSKTAIFYVGKNDNLIYSIYWNGSAFVSKALTTSCQTPASYKITGTSNLLYYIGTDNRVHQLKNLSGTLKSTNNNMVENIGNEIEILQNKADSKIHVYPNPSGGMVNVIIEYAVPGIVKIFNQSGQLVLEKEFSSDNFQVDLSPYPKGLYIFIVTSGNELMKEVVVKN